MMIAAIAEEESHEGIISRWWRHYAIHFDLIPVFDLDNRERPLIMITIALHQGWLGERCADGAGEEANSRQALFDRKRKICHQHQYLQVHRETDNV